MEIDVLLMDIKYAENAISLNMVNTHLFSKLVIAKNKYLLSLCILLVYLINWPSSMKNKELFSTSNDSQKPRKHFRRLLYIYIC